MVTQLIMPKLGMEMLDGILVEWGKNEGQKVEKGEIVFVVETEKVTYEVEAEVAGYLHIIIPIGTQVPVGDVVGELAENEAEYKQLLTRAGISPRGISLGSDMEAVNDLASIQSKETKEPAVLTGQGTKGNQIPGISPLARKLAAEYNVDLSGLKGTGPGGRIIKEDILKAAEESKQISKAAGSRAAAHQSVSNEVTLVPLTAIRKTIAQRMSLSFHTAPHFWVNAEVDFSNLMKVREQLQPFIEKETEVKLTYTDLLIKITAEALKRHPDLNASWTDQGIKLWHRIDVGVATDIPGGLVVPVIRHADQKSLAEIVVTRAELIAKGREKKLDAQDMTGSTFTLNNVGALGIRSINAILNPPESAILTVGSISNKPVVFNNQITIRPVVELSLAVDHRVIDGSGGGRFLQFAKELIENPTLLLM